MSVAARRAAFVSDFGMLINREESVCFIIDVQGKRVYDYNWKVLEAHFYLN